MVAKLLVTEQDGTPNQIVFADHATDFAPSTANSLEFGTPTDCQLDLTGLGNSAYRASTQCDLGANRAEQYAVRMCVEIASTPTAGNTIDLYWAPSSNSTAANGNPGNVTGTDAAWDGYSGSNGDDTIRQLVWIGTLVCTADAATTKQVGECGVFSPTQRYGCLVVHNGSGASFDSDAIQHHVTFDPIVPESQ